MKKNNQHRFTGIRGLVMPKNKNNNKIRTLDDICQMFQRRVLHMVVRRENGREKLFGGRFDKKPLPASFYVTFKAYQAELLDLVSHNDPRVCIEPLTLLHSDSIRTDEQGRPFCHACRTYRQASEYIREAGELDPDPS